MTACGSVSCCSAAMRIRYRTRRGSWRPEYPEHGRHLGAVRLAVDPAHAECSGSVTAGRGYLCARPVLYEDPATSSTTATWLLEAANGVAAEVCTSVADFDYDGLAGCADDDCWGVCRPAGRCGDGVCTLAENCRICPADCAIGVGYARPSAATRSAIPPRRSGTVPATARLSRRT